MIALRLADGLGLGRRANRALGLVLPPRCLVCGETVHETGTLCARCWKGIVFLAPPCCAICGFPFEFDPGPGALCGACIAAPPVFARARAVLRYTEASRGLILAFKHGDRTDAAPAYARWMVRAGEALVADSDIIAPVPLHRLRLLARRYTSRRCWRRRSAAVRPSA